VKDRDTAQRSAHPFRVVFCELRVHGFEEWSNEGDFECRSDNVALLRDVLVYSQSAIRSSSVLPGALTLVVDHQSDKQGQQDGQQTETLRLLDHGLEEASYLSRVCCSWRVRHVCQWRRKAGVGGHDKLNMVCAVNKFLSCRENVGKTGWEDSETDARVVLGEGYN